MAQQPPLSRRFSIGYALAPKKQQSFIRSSLINLAKERGIDLIKIDTEKALIEQGPFDCVLHKLYGEDWKRKLADYKSRYPNVAIIDAPESIERLHNRISMLQEFVNHGGVIFKVYVVGDKVKCVKRKSLPDVTEDELESCGGIMRFSQISNLASNQRIDEKFYEMMQLGDCEMPPQKFITDIARGLRDALKLNLFNFDVIRDTRLGNRYLVIDINYFPGYAKMPAYESVLTDFFWDVVTKKETDNALCNKNVENLGSKSVEESDKRSKKSEN